MGNDTPRISQAPPRPTSLNYAALREEGMELIRRLADRTWTDHNVHDPGITMLEAFVYAMTDVGLRIQLDMADLLRSGESQALPNLPPVPRVLPCGPVTPQDLRRVLLDHHLVGDAWIAPEAKSEVPIYLDDTVAPGDLPLTFAEGGDPVRLQGLFELLLAFEQRDRNSNTYSLDLQVGDATYTLDLALPHWDEKEAAPFRQGASLDSIQMVDPGAGVWRPLEEPQTYFGELDVGYTGSGLSDTIRLWVVLRITDQLEQPGAVTLGILAEARVLLETVGPGTVGARFAERVREAFGAVVQVRRYAEMRRNLCEQPVRPAAVRVQEIALGARIEVTGGADLERLLAEIFSAADRELSPTIRFNSLQQMLDKGRSVEEIFSGPLLGHGFLDDEDLQPQARRSILYTSDVLRLIMRLRRAGGGDLVAQENPGGRDIVAVSDLRLSNFVNNRPVTTDARDCLRLVDPERFRPRLSLAKSRIVFVRDEVEVEYDRVRVQALFDEMRQQHEETARPRGPRADLPVPQGEPLPIEEYFPFQNDLPRIYGVGEFGLPESAGSQRRAQALQTKGYLLLFEQFLADITAQLGAVNRFFSADPDEAATYFIHPLFEVPEVRKLLSSFPAAGDETEWSAFLSDPENPHRSALEAAVEDRDRFLDRRNRMFDHLLARQGEEAVALGQELHRWGRRELVDAGVSPELFPLRTEERRRAINARLMRAKAAFLSDLPDLHARRLQSFGGPLDRLPQLLELEELDQRFHWTLDLVAEVQLRSLRSGQDSGFRTEAGATIAAEEAALLAVRSGFYVIAEEEGGVRRLQLSDGFRTLAESAQTFPSLAEAEQARDRTVARLANLRREHSLTPMERRIAHLIGIRSQLRRRLATPLDDFFEIFADSEEAVDGRRWRLYQLPGHSGPTLMVGSQLFDAPSDEEEIALAQSSIQRVLRHGLDEWNYRITTSGGNTFEMALLEPSGDTLGVRTPPPTSQLEAEQGVEETISHLYLRYSGEGFHLVEHILLRPRNEGDAFLDLPADGVRRETDPYSHRLSLVFPSGYQRDFSLDPASSPRELATPHRFRDPEFRRHAERIVRQACPAHLLPTIHWVDRQAPNTPDSEASFDGFEDRYFDWLDTVLTPGSANEASVRNALVDSLNAIAGQ